MADETLLELAADIVTAHVSNNSVSTEDLPKLIASVYSSLAGLGHEPEQIEEKRAPAVSLRSSIKHDTIACLECGARMKLLKRHLHTEHNLSPEEYRARWGLAFDYPMIAPEYATRRKDLAHQIGLGRKVASAPKQKAPKAENGDPAENGTEKRPARRKKTAEA